MSEGAGPRWAGAVSNDELTAGELPPPGASWSILVHFAATLNGYEALGAETEGLQAFADDVKARYATSGELLDDLTRLRAALFSEQRRDYWTGGWGDPSPETMRYVHALVEAIRAAVKSDGGRPSD